MKVHRVLKIVGGLITAALFSLSLGCTPSDYGYVSRMKVQDIANLFASDGEDDVSFSSLFSGVQILNIQPVSYFEQNIPFCGGFSIAGIVSAYGMHDFSGSEFMTNWGKLFGGMTPSQAVTVMGKYNIQPTLLRAGKISDVERIQLLKDEIDGGKPIMLLIGNGFLHDGRYSNLKSQFPTSLHWITVWGYHENGFFIYDSALSPTSYSFVPIGNSERSFSNLLGSWAKPSYLSPFLGYTYITSEPPLRAADPI